MAMKVPLSFKETEKNMYDYLMKQLSPSIFVKGLIKAAMEREEPAGLPKEPKKSNLLDF